MIRNFIVSVFAVSTVLASSALADSSHNNKATVYAECRKGSEVVWTSGTDHYVADAKAQAEEACLNYGGELTGVEYTYGAGL